MQVLRGYGSEDTHEGDCEEPRGLITQLFQTLSSMACEIDGLICCIDAVDECNEFETELLRYVDRLVCSRSSSIKFILAGRPGHFDFPSSETEINIIEVPNSASKQDLGRFVHTTIDSRQTLEVDSKARVAEKLKMSAKGIFLWAKFALEEIDNGPADDAHISELPQGLGDFYHRKLESRPFTSKPQESSLLCTILNWISAVIRPLKVGELAMALAIEPGDLKLERSNMLWDPARTFVEMGSTLILVSDGIVRPVHASLTDFLCTDRAPSITAGSGLTVPIKKEKANAYLALTCITYLSFQDFTHAYGSQNQDMIGFLDYAATSWYQHAVLAGKDLHIYEAVVNFLRLPQGFEWMDGLLTYLGKSFVFLLEIQTQLSQ